MTVHEDEAAGRLGDRENGVEVANEFTSVRLTLVETPNGTRLEIFSPRLGYRIRLDPVALESLTWQPAETFSGFLSTPLGPDR